MALDRKGLRPEQKRFFAKVPPELFGCPSPARLYLIIGVRGAGKSTLIRRLVSRNDLHVVRVLTSRGPRGGFPELEYEYQAAAWPVPDVFAWEFILRAYHYGVKWSEIEKVRVKGRGVAVYHAGSLRLLSRRLLRRHGVSVETVGLDTVATIQDQRDRVDSLPERVMTLEEFLRERQAVLGADYVIGGDSDAVYEQFMSILQLTL